jgi:hypothetical protein
MCPACDVTVVQVTVVSVGPKLAVVRPLRLPGTATLQVTPKLVKGFLHCDRKRIQTLENTLTDFDLIPHDLPLLVRLGKGAHADEATKLKGGNACLNMYHLRLKHDVTTVTPSSTGQRDPSTNFAITPYVA